MARKRRSPLVEPPPASSSEEGPASRSEESEPEPNPKITTKKQIPAVKPQSPPSGESESDGEKVTTPPKVSKTKSKLPASPAPAKFGTKRRTNGGESEPIKESKKAKNKKKGDDAVENGVGEELDKKSKMFQRIWSDEDEVIILKGMSDYAVKKGVDPYADMTAFHEFIKKSLRVDVSKSQLQDKIRRMKKKYENNVKSKHKPTKPHDLEAFELSKKVWGGGGGGEDGLSKKVVGGGEDLAELVTIASYGNTELPKANGKAKTESDQRDSSKSLASPERSKGALKKELFPRPYTSGSVSAKVIGFDKGFQKMGLSETIMQQGLELIGESKCADLRDGWRELHVIELKLFVRKTELMKNQAKMMLDALKSGD